MTSIPEPAEPWITNGVIAGRVDGAGVAVDEVGRAVDFGDGVGVFVPGVVDEVVRGTGVPGLVVLGDALLLGETARVGETLARGLGVGVGVADSFSVTARAEYSDRIIAATVNEIRVLFMGGDCCYLRPKEKE